MEKPGKSDHYGDGKQKDEFGKLKKFIVNGRKD